MIRSIITVFCLLVSCSLWAKEGYKISVTVEGFAEKEAYLGYHFGDKQYIQDTVSAGKRLFCFQRRGSSQGRFLPGHPSPGQ